MGPWLPVPMVLPATYGKLNPGSKWVSICLRNLSAHPIVIPTKVVMVRVTLANQVPQLVLLTGSSGESGHSPWKDWILEELNLQGM